MQESPAAPISSPNDGGCLQLKREMKRWTDVLVANRRMELDLERRLRLSKTWPIERTTSVDLLARHGDRLSLAGEFER